MRSTVLSMLFCLCLHAAAAPDPAALADALSSAAILWGITVTDPIEFRVESLGACYLGPGSLAQIATTETLDSVTTLRFDEGPPVLSHQFRFIIRLNSGCDWSRLHLQETVMHEYGHILIGGGWHSRDRRSVMYPVVMGGQQITAGDRRMVDKMAKMQGYGE